jgi:1,4-alpha-glucan branching enzyme
MLYLDYGRENGKWRPNKDGGNYNLEAIDFLKELNAEVLKRNKGKIMIAEESTAFPLITKPPYDGGLGFNFKWNMGWMNDSLKYISANPFFRQNMHNLLTFSITYAFSENYILPISHDEVVHGKCSMIEKMPGDYYEKFSLLKAFMGYMMTHPGKKLLFMGCEFAQFIEWDYKKELDWFLLDYESHNKFMTFMKDLNKYYLDHSELYELDTTYDGFKWVIPNDNTHNIICFNRFNKNGDYTTVLINFSPVEVKNYFVGVKEFKKYKAILCSNDKKYGGSGDLKKTYKPIKGNMHDFMQYIKVDIKPNGVMLFKAVDDEGVLK